MIQARGLWAGKGLDLMLTFLLLVSMLCMIMGEAADGVSFPAKPDAVCTAADGRMEGTAPERGQEAIEEIRASVYVDGEDVSSAGSASVLLWKSTSARLARAAVWLAGFLFMGKMIPFCTGGSLSAFLHRETPGRARFLRELFIQKKKDGKKRRVF